MTLQDLSDDELLQRLINRGMTHTDAKSWVEYREALGAPAQLAYLLEEDTPEEEE